ncbi:putative D,D-dipeptide transport ATP-binding protein DdpF, partial [Haemophilus influenzae]
MPLLQVEDLT